MFGITWNKPVLANLGDTKLSLYGLNFSLDRLSLGVDNIRYDVYLSPAFHTAVTRFIPQLIARHFKAEAAFPVEDGPAWTESRKEFKRLYLQMMVEAVNRAKLRSEPQIDYLAQVAVLKLLREELRSQFDAMSGRVKKLLHKYGLTSGRRQENEDLKTRETLTAILQNREQLLRDISSDMFQHLVEVQTTDLQPMREAVFGAEGLLPESFFETPFLQTENPYNDFFLIKEYDIVFGRRLEDPDKYDTLVALIQRLLSALFRLDPQSRKLIAPPADGQTPLMAKADDFARLLKQNENVDILFNVFLSRESYRRQKKQKADAQTLRALKRRIREQQKLLNFFFRDFNQSRLIERIAAFYEMRGVYLDYCPPLVPQQIIQYLIFPKTRRSVVQRLKRLKEIHGRPYSLTPLRRTIKRIKYLTYTDKKKYLIRFLNSLARYYRDFENFKIISDAMEQINLTVDEKLLHLSRENNTLHEFLLPHEQPQEEKPIINHVIVKADVRGSTDITHQMLARGLNPASYFSLNFFDPISDKLPEYDAAKVFIEGDAIILAILEREETPGGWYSVARACGMALNMLMIIQRYNTVSRKHQLPIMELGIGICHRNTTPTFLFDGSNRIMISSAINLADRLSSCSKAVRRKIRSGPPQPFNLFVFQTQPDDVVEATADDIFLRYNVNGIELNADGFEKLSREIKLQVVEAHLPDLPVDRVKLYTGKFPTTTGKYQRLVIREAHIPEVDPRTLKIRRITARKYYEVCSHPQIYQLVKKDAT